nr:hypothetical protein [Tanacetum cinerariifolium]
MMNEMVKNQLEVATMQVFSKECRKPKRAKDYIYHKEKMLLCKQAEKGVLLQIEQADWLEDTDEKVNEQELEAHYMYMEKIQDVHTTDSGPSIDAEPLEKIHSDDDYNVFASEMQHYEQPVSINNTCLVEKVDSNAIHDSSDMCNNDNQADPNAKECDDERVVLANLIANLKFETDENKKIQKQLKGCAVDSRFVTVVKQTVDLNKESYHKLFDILKWYQNEVNEIRAEMLAKNKNPLALVATAQQYPNPYYQAPNSHKSYAPPSKQSSSIRSHATTRYKCKEIAKPIIPPSELAFEEDSDPEQA